MPTTLHRDAAPAASAPAAPAISLAYAAPHLREPPGTLTERLVVGYLTALPLLWLLGLMLPVALLTVAAGCLLEVRSRRALALAAPWLLVAVLQTISTAVNWGEAELPWATLGRRLLGSYVVGWYVIAACIAVGAAGLVRPAALVRGLRRLAIAALVLAVPSYVLAFTTGLPALRVPSLIGLLLPPELPATAYSFSLYLFVWEDFAGTSLPRISLFFPWPAAMGFAGVCLACIALAGARGRTRGWLLAGGLLLVVASLSRLAMLVCVVCFLLLWFLRRARRPQLLVAGAGLTLLLAAAAASGSWGGPVEQALHGFTVMRPGASDVRGVIERANRDGFRADPWLGQGWPGESLFREHPLLGDSGMVPGSHSTISGLLYKGGLLTFGAFVVAYASLALALLVRLPRSTAARDASALLLAIGVTTIGEGLEALAVPTLWAFVWLGTALYAAPDRAREAGHG